MARFHKKSAPQFIYGIIGGGGLWHYLHFQNLGLRIKRDFAVLGPKAFDGMGNRGMSDNIWWALQEKVAIACVVVGEGIQKVVCFCLIGYWYSIRILGWYDTRTQGYCRGSHLQ